MCNFFASFASAVSFVLSASFVLFVATGITLWPAAFALCEWLLEQYIHAARRPGRILELGAGCGLPGLLAASLHVCASLKAERDVSTVEVVLTDAVDSTLALLQENVAAMTQTSVANIVDVHKLLWGEALPTAMEGYSHAFDVVLGADLCYGSTHEDLHNLFKTINHTLSHEENAFFLACVPIRGTSTELTDHFSLKPLLQAAQHFGFEAALLPRKHSGPRPEEGPSTTFGYEPTLLTGSIDLAMMAFSRIKSKHPHSPNTAPQNGTDPNLNSQMQRLLHALDDRGAKVGQRLFNWPPGWRGSRASAVLVDCGNEIHSKRIIDNSSEQNPLKRPRSSVNLWRDSVLEMDVVAEDESKLKEDCDQNYCNPKSQGSVEEFRFSFSFDSVEE
jgi:hypothetical protein